MPILIILCCLPGLRVTVGYLEQEELGEKKEKQEANFDAANPPVQVEVPIRNRDSADDVADYEKAGGYEEVKNKQAGQREAMRNEEDEKIKVRM